MSATNPEGAVIVHTPAVAAPRAARRFTIAAGLSLAALVIAFSIYANLSFAITNPAHFRYLPPFRPHVNVNANTHLGGEYYQMARALLAGEGFAHPFALPTGPTAWQPPILPLILAGSLWATGSREGVTAIVVCMQDAVLVATMLLVLAVALQSTRRLGPLRVAGVCVLFLVCEFRLFFQFTHDWWIVLLCVDVLIAGLCWLRPLAGWKSAAGWGVFGGLCVMVNPVVGIAWTVLSAVVALRERSWRPLAITLMAAALTLAPWTIRNYLIFGRLIPSKSNLAFELYQSQCLQQNGLLLRFVGHPYSVHTAEGKEYQALGEAAYLDRKWEQYCSSIAADPLDFLDRVACRILGATLWYVPFHRGEGTARWDLWCHRVLHPLPFLALLFLVYTSFWRALHPAQWIVIAVYVLYLVPYIGASYYDRYGIPLLPVKLLLVVWALDRLASLAREWRPRA
jgi:hypothetical protein